MNHFAIKWYLSLQSIEIEHYLIMLTCLFLWSSICRILYLFRSKGDAQAMFLRHEGFLGALGAFMSYEKHGLDDLMVHQLVERFPMGAPYTGGKIHGPPLGDLNEKVSI